MRLKPGEFDQIIGNRRILELMLNSLECLRDDQDAIWGKREIGTWAHDTARNNSNHLDEAIGGLESALEALKLIDERILERDE